MKSKALIIGGYIIAIILFMSSIFFGVEACNYSEYGELPFVDYLFLAISLALSIFSFGSFVLTGASVLGENKDTVFGKIAIILSILSLLVIPVFVFLFFA